MHGGCGVISRIDTFRRVEDWLLRCGVVMRAVVVYFFPICRSSGAYIPPHRPYDAISFHDGNQAAKLYHNRVAMLC